eukprot:CAMPEP_0184493986 /NCGR_PEP_ID=MMETSP0113_2-20130426/27492_1 /TAXON_ID=91329 /ORGANISM="Norrisiella sphaerica, Strain BC52" /LENGTH=399 /DNA_ID=CAMNT_0026879509 /DNA_START=19 /DNA_END=1218 /DNA_ORIENTATION=+
MKKRILKRCGGGRETQAPPRKENPPKRNYVDQVSTCEMKKNANLIRHSRLVLHVAAQIGNEQITKQLLKGGWHTDGRDIFGQTPLHHAAKRDNDGVSKALIESKANITMMNNEGLTPLHVACSHGSLRVAKLLLKSAVNVDCDDAKGETPLHAAARSGRTAVVKLLLEQKASLHRPNFNGESPLDVACSSAKKRMTLVACTHFGETPKILPRLRTSSNDKLVRCPSAPDTPPTPPLPLFFPFGGDSEDPAKSKSSGKAQEILPRSKELEPVRDEPVRDESTEWHSEGVRKVSGRKRRRAESSRSEIQKSVVIAGTRRRNGTFRKAIRIRPGFKSEEVLLREARESRRRELEMKNKEGHEGNLFEIVEDSTKIKHGALQTSSKNESQSEHDRPAHVSPTL